MRTTSHGFLASAVMVAAVSGAVGCVADEPSLGSADQAVTTENRIAVNRIAINRIAINRIAINRIAINRIAINRIAINSLGEETLTVDPDAIAPFLVDEQGAPSPEGELVFAYLIECAFPGGVQFEGPGADGELRLYEGGIGLAKNWAVRGLTTDEKAWLSSCMIARVNVNQVPVEISLRGPDKALDTSPIERAAFAVEEGAFYGDIFTGEAPIRAFACRGTRLTPAASEADRQCANPGTEPGLTVCGMTYAGECADVCKDRVSKNGGYYRKCDAGAEQFDQPITVFLR